MHIYYAQKSPTLPGCMHIYTVNEVVAELDGSDLEHSEDDLMSIWTLKVMMSPTRIREGTELWRETKKELRKRMFLFKQTYRERVIDLLSSPLAFLPNTPFSLAVQLL